MTSVMSTDCWQVCRLLTNRICLMGFIAVAIAVVPHDPIATPEHVQNMLSMDGPMTRSLLLQLAAGARTRARPPSAAARSAARRGPGAPQQAPIPAWAPPGVFCFVFGLSWHL